MPLVWAHAEYIKLRRSLRDGRVFDMPPQPLQRYVLGQARSAPAIWCLHQKCRSIAAGKSLRIMSRNRAVVHWSLDGWGTWQDTELSDSGVDLYWADLPTNDLAPGRSIVFALYRPDAGRWEDANFEVTVEAARP